MEESKKGTPDQQIAHKAKVWHQHDQQAIADKADRKKQSAEWAARQELRRTIDDAREH